MMARLVGILLIGLALATVPAAGQGTVPCDPQGGPPGSGRGLDLDGDGQWDPADEPCVPGTPPPPPPPPAPTVPQDTVTVTSTGEDATGNEVGPDTIVFTVARTGGPPTELSVNFRLEGTATNGADYTSPGLVQDDKNATGTVKIPASSMSAPVTITPQFDLDGSAGELAGETVKFILVDTADYELGEGAARQVNGTITNFAHNTVSVRATSATAPDLTTTEDDPQTAAFDAANVTVERTGSLAFSLDVLLKFDMTGSGSSVPADYRVTILGTPSTSLDIPADGDVTLQMASNVAKLDLQIQAVRDLAQEGAETLRINPRAGPSTGNQNNRYVLGTNVILNVVDEDLPVVSISAPVGTTQEATVPTVGRFLVTRNAAPAAALDVKVSFAAVASGVAALGTDFTASPTPTAAGFVTIPAGKHSLNITITPINDTALEGTEVVQLTVGTVAGMYQTGTPSLATVTLLDDDLPIVAIETLDASAGEASGATAKVKLTRTATAASPLTAGMEVKLTYSTTSAVAADYDVAPTGTTVTIPAGKNHLNLTITPRDDSTVESAETLTITVAVPPTLTYGIGVPAVATITIADNDQVVDADGDGIADTTDLCDNLASSDNQDTDADGKGNPCDDDDDDDGLLDVDEAKHGTNALSADTDGDGRLDGAEVTAKTSPTNFLDPDFRVNAVKAASNGYGVNVTWTAPTGSLANRYLIFMASGTPTLVEAVASIVGTTLYKFNDAKFPGGEHEYYVQAMLPSLSTSTYNATLARTSPDAKLNLTLCQAYAADRDGDQLCDRAEEITHKTDPGAVDTDGDGISDFDEVQTGSDPLLGRTAGADKVRLATEIPFWIGLGLVLAVVVLVVVGIGMSRRRA